MSINTSIILHWYPESPFSQKVAWALNFKNIDYKLVHISRIEPRPERRPVDGGFRKTPVLQIGNHTYCDTKAIFTELEKRFPEPSFYPIGCQGESTKANVESLARWLDTGIFMCIATQFPVDKLDDSFLKDRAQFSGRDMNRNSLKAKAPFLRHSLVSELILLQNFLADRIDDEKKWALGTYEPSLLDLHIAMDSWFVSALVGFGWLQETVPLLSSHLKKTLELAKYEETQSKEHIKPEEAIKILKTELIDLDKPVHSSSLPIKLGETVAVYPTDNGIVPCIGKLAHSTLEETVIEHHNEEHGTTVYIHFPVIGFIVMPFNSKL